MARGESPWQLSCHGIVAPRLERTSMARVRTVLRKHGWILPVCAVGCAALSAWVTTRLPKKYMSRSVVLVAQPTATAVTEDLNQRLASMKEQILSRPRLEPVFEKLD